MPPIDLVVRKYQRELSQILGSPAFKQLLTLAIIALSIAFLIDRFNRTRNNPRNQPINQPINRAANTANNRPNQNSAVGRLLSSIAQATNQSTNHLTPSQKYFVNQSKANRSIIVQSDCLFFDDRHYLNPAVRQAIKSLSSACRVVIVHQCNEDDDASEIQLIENLSINQLIGAEIDGLIPSHRVVTCTTEKGAIAIIRQLEPALLIATSTPIVNAVKPFIIDCLLIDHNTKVKSFSPPMLYPINTINGLSNYSVTSATHAKRPIVTLASLDQWFNGVKLVEDDKPINQSLTQSINQSTSNQTKESALPASSQSLSEDNAH